MKQDRLKNLSREQKLLLYDLIQEQKRRLREKKDIYKPNPGQQPVHLSQKKVRFVGAGNGGGKTALAVNEVIWAATGYNPVNKTFSKVPAKIVVLLDLPDKVTDLWIPELKKWTNLDDDWCKKQGRPYVTKIIWPNGSEISFMFHQQDQQAFESIEVDFVCADEPPPRFAYVGLRRGGRKKNRESRYLIVGTPVSQAWIRREIVEPWERGELPDTECFAYGTIENEANLAENFIEEFSRVLSDREKEIRLYGKFYDLDGLALAHLLHADKHIVAPFEWPSDWPVVVAVDPHGAKPTHACMLGIDPDNYLYYIKELRLKAIARDFAIALKQWYQGYKVFDIVVDSLGSSEFSSGEGFKSFIQVLQEEGVRARPTTFKDKNDEDFIDRIRSALEIREETDEDGTKALLRPKLSIFETNRGIISDIQNVQWVKHRHYEEFKPKLDISNKDYLSCLKYALASNVTYTKTKSKMFRRIKGAETYGAKKQPKSQEYYKVKLGLKRGRNVKNKRRSEDSWENW